MRVKLIAALLAVCCFIYPLAAFADGQLQKAEFSQRDVQVPSGANEFSLDILVTNKAAFSSAEFGLQLDAGLQIKSVRLGSGITGSPVNVLEKNGISYFGFFDTKNNYAGTVNVCTVVFGYEGDAAASVTLKEASVTTITANGGAAKETTAPDAIAHVTRLSAGNGSTPGGGGTQGGGGGTSATDPIIDPDNGRATVKLDANAIANALEQAVTDANGYTVLAFDLTSETSRAEEAAIVFPVDLIQTAAKQKLLIRTSLGTIEIPAGAIGKQQSGNASAVTLVVKKAGGAALPADAADQSGRRLAVDIHFELDGQPIAWSNDLTPVHVMLPYEPTVEEKSHPDNLLVYYVDDSNGWHVMPGSRYDAAAGTIGFYANHFSRFAVAPASMTFSDTGNSWAVKEIESLAIRGIITGRTTDTFDPNAQVTRADFTKLLIGVLGRTAPASGSVVFSDVKGSDYYYDAVMTARTLGLAAGTADNAFEPKNPITRQDMMVLLDRAFALSGKPFAAMAELSAYKDAGQLSAYARDSAAKLIAADVIAGSDGKLRPKDRLTRAEAAKVLYKLFGLLY
ncbi:S-layer homology domain-containing protein [Paenibacillus rhizovicinus]|uniref:S-layer homology domain-containing protein n=1 Tax=Paenibacillus rhizovicinus TaxID=2704463 RepID=A0A6C0P517_9BACL|nr:S-layer homology domain-containing protein [Paenibacillus rhizovicinus]QHW33589.1 S-layer homology domain-containing protein [Paenibacillus rhizovicinus]